MISLLTIAFGFGLYTIVHRENIKDKVVTKYNDIKQEIKEAWEQAKAEVEKEEQDIIDNYD